MPLSLLVWSFCIIFNMYSIHPIAWATVLGMQGSIYIVEILFGGIVSPHIARLGEEVNFYLGISSYLL